MESKGRITHMAYSYDGRPQVTLELSREAADFLDDLKDKELRVELKRWRNKRSLSANSYFYVLCQKIADALNSSVVEVHNDLIMRYGQHEYITKDGEEHLHLTIEREDYDWRTDETRHLFPTTHTQELSDGNIWRVYIVQRGSHTYNSKEMSLLITGAVNEAKELGLEVLSSEELEGLWQIR